MDIATLTAELAIRGLTPTVTDGKLAVAGPTDRLTAPLKAGLAEHRDTLRLMLTPRATRSVHMTGTGAAGKGPVKRTDLTADLPPEDADGQTDAAFADTPAADDGLRTCGDYFMRLAEEVRDRNPRHLRNLAIDPRGDPCRRCGFTPASLTLIHHGESVRRDCATCGAFAGFTAWHNADAAAGAMAEANERAREHREGVA
ncbi:hypothetical protein [Botrimarina sp.]|uniref:hypothetical protein n=1 Tax=Botrimarina sp. TaxID=2795802 RepID=UPI0032ECEFBA